MSETPTLHTDSEISQSASQFCQKAHPFVIHAVLRCREKWPEVTGHYPALNNNVSYPADQFRFLDLPAELRLHIASYTVTDGDAWPLEFQWTTYTPKKKVGSFVTALRDVDIDELTARTRAMRFTHAEARDLIWANNGLLFDHDPVKCTRSPGTPQSNVTDSWKYIEEAFGYALLHYPEAFRKTPQVVIDTFFSDMKGQLRGGVFPTMTKLAASLPDVPFRFRDINCLLLPTWIEMPSTMTALVVVGRKLKAQQALSSETGRNWRLYPYVFQDKNRSLVAHPDETEFKEFLEWAENGL